MFSLIWIFHWLNEIPSVTDPEEPPVEIGNIMYNQDLFHITTALLHNTTLLYFITLSFEHRETIRSSPHEHLAGVLSNKGKRWQVAFGWINNFCKSKPVWIFRSLTAWSLIWSVCEVATPIRSCGPLVSRRLLVQLLWIFMSIMQLL